MRVKSLLSLAMIALLAVACGDGERDVRSKPDATTSSESHSVYNPIKRPDIPIIRSPACDPYAEPIRNSELAAMLKKLKRAVAKKDTVLLLSLMDADVVTSHGGGEYGYDALIANWKMDHHDLWQQLEALIEIGGSYSSDRSYVFPYFHNYKKCNNITKSFLEKDDPYWTYISIKDTVLLYNAPDVRANVKAKLRYAFVHVKDFSTFAEKGFLKVTTYQNDLVGYVKENEVYRTGDYNLHIEKGKNGVWRITAFAPYD